MGPDSKRILFVDGDRSRAAELAGVFRELNFDIVMSRSSDEASANLREGRFDIILASADAGSRGYDLCRVLRESPPTADLPIVILSAAPDADSQFSRHQRGPTRANGYVKCPAPPEEIVDWVERLVGLPPPPDGSAARAAPAAEGKDEREVLSLRREMEALQEQIHFYEQQLAQVSMKGEQDAREIDQLLGELQKDLEKTRKEKDQVRDELALLKSDLGKKDRELREHEQHAAGIREEWEREKGELRLELNELRKTFEESEEKHRRAQNALREYYKPKLAGTQKLEKTVSVLEDELVKLSSELKQWREKCAGAEQELKRAKDEFAREREKTQKIRAAIEEAVRDIE